MSIRLHHVSSKNAVSFYAIRDITNPKTGKRTTQRVHKFGTLAHLQAELNTSDRDEIESYLRSQIRLMNEEEKKKTAHVILELSPARLIPFDTASSYIAGFLYPQAILTALGIPQICSAICEEHQFKYDLASILNDLVLARILFPCSKRSTLKEMKKLPLKTEWELHQVYRALPVLAENRYPIETELYKRSARIAERNNSVLYYDCTNFYFEIEDAADLKQYGHSKENRPNPIVQYGLFMDANGLPLADIVFPGNENEQKSLRKLEERIEKDFGESRFIVCADAGLNSWDNKIYNDRKDGRAYIVTQPVKKLKKHLKEWTLSPEGWTVLGSHRTYDLNDLPEEITLSDRRTVRTDDAVFYKDRWISETRTVNGKKEKLEEHLIASFSLKFKRYQERIRNEKIKRAEKMISTPGKIKKTNNQRDPRYFICRTDNTETGEAATETTFTIDVEKVEEDRRYDGFYAVTTDLEDEDLGLIIQANKGRWEIEESFEIMKSELKTRPIYVTRDHCIEGHLLICFIALLVYRLLETKVNDPGNGKFWTCPEIIRTLREMTVTEVGGYDYIPAFTRTGLTDRLAEVFGFQLATEVVPGRCLREYIRKSREQNITQKLRI